MTPLANTAWWIVFLAAGIILQATFPGLDALILGLPLLLEERDYRRLVCFVPAVILLQDGMGTQAFGSAMLSIALCSLFYWLARGIASASRIGFYLFLSLCMGGIRIFLDWLFATLEDTAFVPEQLFHEGAAEAVYLFIGWIVLRHLRQECVQQGTDA